MEREGRKTGPCREFRRLQPRYLGRTARDDAAAARDGARALMSSEHRVWKAHMRMALSNERTLISWIRVGATYGSGALVAATLAGGQTEERAGRFTLTIQALLGLFIVTWATVLYALRGRLLAARWPCARKAGLRHPCRQVISC